MLPILAYGNSILRTKCKKIDPDFGNLTELIDEMFQTMYNAKGVGLAAPQIGKDIRVFIIDTSPFEDDDDFNEIPLKKVFINAEIINESGEEWSFSEGCLSIPEVREEIKRKSNITINYFDENFINHQDTFSGINARVIQHEYDHIEGKLFTDRISFLRKKLIKRKLEKISVGNISVEYRMSFSR